MPQSLAQVYLHVVFSTKERYAYFADAALRDETHRYLGGTCNKLGCPILRVGGATDHVHILFLLGRTIAIADLVKELKRESSQWLKGKGESLANFHWQSGYGAFSVSRGHVDALLGYISNQLDHHTSVSFQDEFRRLLRAYRMEWDERFVWD